MTIACPSDILSLLAPPLTNLLSQISSCDTQVIAFLFTMLMAPKSLLDSHTPGPHKCISVPYTFRIMFTVGNADRYINRNIGRRSGRHSIDTRSPLGPLSIDN